MLLIFKNPEIHFPFIGFCGEGGGWDSLTFWAGEVGLDHFGFGELGLTHILGGGGTHILGGGWDSHFGWEGWDSIILGLWEWDSLTFCVGVGLTFWVGRVGLTHILGWGWDSLTF